MTLPREAFLNHFTRADLWSFVTSAVTTNLNTGPGGVVLSQEPKRNIAVDMAVRFHAKVRAALSDTSVDTQFETMYHFLAGMAPGEGLTGAELKMFAEEYCVQTRVDAVKGGRDVFYPALDHWRQARTNLLEAQRDVDEHQERNQERNKQADMEDAEDTEDPAEVAAAAKMAAAEEAAEAAAAQGRLEVA